MNSDTQHRHLDDADIARLADGELRDTRADRALEECDVCHERVRRLRQRTATLSTILAAADWETPDAAASLAAIQQARARTLAARSRRAAQLRIAAAVSLILLGGALMVTPAAAWIGRALQQAWTTLTTRDAPAPAPAAPEPATPDASARYAYAPAAGTLTIRVDQASGGSLELRAVGDTMLALTFTGTPPQDVLLLPNELRITGAGDYQVSIPAQVSEVRVIAGGRVTGTFPRASITAPVRQGL